MIVKCASSIHQSALASAAPLLLLLAADLYLILSCLSQRNYLFRVHKEYGTIAVQIEANTSDVEPIVVKP